MLTSTRKILATWKIHIFVANLTYFVSSNTVSLCVVLVLCSEFICSYRLCGTEPHTGMGLPDFVDWGSFRANSEKGFGVTFLFQSNESVLPIGFPFQQSQYCACSRVGTFIVHIQCMCIPFPHTSIYSSVTQDFLSKSPIQPYSLSRDSRQGVAAQRWHHWQLALCGDCHFFLILFHLTYIPFSPTIPTSGGVRPRSIIDQSLRIVTCWSPALQAVGSGLCFRNSSSMRRRTLSLQPLLVPPIRVSVTFSSRAYKILLARWLPKSRVAAPTEEWPRPLLFRNWTRPFATHPIGFGRGDHALTSLRPYIS